jgi:hypothetical protein
MSDARIKNEVGNRYGMLTVLRPYEGLRGCGAIWLCKCDCGNEIMVRASYFKTGHIKSCGCSRRKIKDGYIHN